MLLVVWLVVAYGLAALTYFPLPGLAWALARGQPDSRFMRFHAWQGGLLTLALWVCLVFVGFLSLVGTGKGFTTTVGFVAAACCIAWLMLALGGAIGAMTGRYQRVALVFGVAQWLQRRTLRNPS